MFKKFTSIFALLVVLTFLVTGCSGQPAVQPVAAESATAPIDNVAVTKEAAWDGYKKILTDASGKIFPMDPVKAKELMQGNEAKYLVIDLRTSEDYAKGHVKGAVNIPLDKFVEHLDKLPTDKTLILYCYNGQASALTMVPLKYYGYKAVPISKGFPAVEKAGYAIDTTTVEFKPVQATKPTDAKVAAAQQGLKDAFDAIVKQGAKKPLILKGSDVKPLLEADADKYFIVDLRTAEVYAKGHVKGAVNIPLAQLPDKAGSLPKDKTLVVYYCYSGQTTAMTTVPLTAEGLRLISINTGFPGAEEGALPLEKN